MLPRAHKRAPTISHSELKTICFLIHHKIYASESSSGWFDNCENSLIEQIFNQNTDEGKLTLRVGNLGELHSENDHRSSFVYETLCLCFKRKNRICYLHLPTETGALGNFASKNYRS